MFNFDSIFIISPEKKGKERLEAMQVYHVVAPSQGMAT